jgi:hypothetical protein
VTFWRGNKVPGVADQIRKTQLKQDQKARKREMEELTRLVEEGRLHEADERQLETLRLIADLRQAFDAPSEAAAPAAAPTDNAEIIEAVKQAMGEAMANMPAGRGLSPAEDPDRPKMKHTSLADLAQGKDDVTISHGGDLGEEETSTEDSTDKLEKLRKLKGQ